MRGSIDGQCRKDNLLPCGFQGRTARLFSKSKLWHRNGFTKEKERKHVALATPRELKVLGAWKEGRGRDLCNTKNCNHHTRTTVVLVT